LSSLSSIDPSAIDSRLQDISFEIACDVDNPLIGSKGASVIFAPQKGADSEMIAQLDANLTHYSDILTSTIKKDVSEVPGSGAAGGIGSAFLAFLNAELKSGINIILDAIDFEHHIKGADLVITGEGRFDSQSIRGKAPIGVAKSAKRNRCLVFVIAGSVTDDGLMHKHDIDRIFSVVSNRLTLEQAFANPSESITLVSISAAKYFRDHH
jgi:glycerate kinase